MCPTCQYEICHLPADSSCLTRVVAGSWCFIQSHTHPHAHPHTPFLVTVCHYALFQHVMDTLQLKCLVLGVFSERRRALSHVGSVVLLMDYLCLLFLFFLGLLLYCENTTVIAPLGVSLTGFITLTLPRFNSQSPDWKKKFFRWSENCLFALVRNKRHLEFDG